MINSVKLFVARLNADSSFITLLGTGGKVYGEILPTGVDPSAARAVLVQSRGGDSHLEIATWAKDRLQVTVYAGKGQQLQAKDVDLALRNLMHDKDNVSGFRSCVCITNGQSVTDPSTGWATMVSFYQMTVQG